MRHAVDSDSKGLKYILTVHIVLLKAHIPSKKQVQYGVFEKVSERRRIAASHKSCGLML